MTAAVVQQTNEDKLQHTLEQRDALTAIFKDICVINAVSANVMPKAIINDHQDSKTHNQAPIEATMVQVDHQVDLLPQQLA
jgi:hypothetical protein